MGLTRRDLLTGAAGLAAVAAANGKARAQAPTAGGATVSLTAQAMRHVLPGAEGEKEILSFDGTLAGPVLRVPKGAPLDVSLTNRLDMPLALQWHGVCAADAIEGNFPLAGAPIAIGATQAIRFTPPDSGLFWFHPAALPGQPDLTARGLRGVLIVEETEPPAADRDVLLSLADWRFGAGAPPLLTVNCRAAPERVTMAPGARLRLRILNASTLRPMILGLEGARPLIVAIDGQPSDLFEPLKDSVPVGPGARFEFLIDLPRDAGAMMRVVLREGAGSTSLFECRTEGEPREALPAIAALPKNPRLQPAIPLESSVRALLRIEAADGQSGPRWRLNGTASLDLPAAPLLRGKPGGPVTLGFDNRSIAIVPLRLHGHVMRLLHPKDDGWEPYWRDSVILLPGSVTHVAFIADNPGRWLIESALFDQAAFGLRSWFEVA